jgi:hypothetical protein
LEIALGCFDFPKIDSLARILEIEGVTDIAMIVGHLKMMGSCFLSFLYFQTFEEKDLMFLISRRIRT